MVDLQRVKNDEQEYYKIENSHLMRPFFMSIVSASNHWMFISSNGGLTAGRKNSEFALFPYYTDDKVTQSAETTGPKTIIRATINGKDQLWEPFSVRGKDHFELRQNLYKHVHGDRIIFEEINKDLNLCFRYRWESSNIYGFLRTAELENLGATTASIEMIDGVQNILPYGVGSELQMRSSNLADAYKRTELHPESGLGIFALSAIIVDKAEPSEALKANVVWSAGLPGAKRLISAQQLTSFRQGHSVTEETDIKGKKGAYLLNSAFELASGAKKSWSIVANVNQDRPAVEKLINELKEPQQLLQRVKADVEAGSKRLTTLAAASDAIQFTADAKKDTRHFSNVLFNIMRGGIFDDDYQIERSDFSTYLKNANRAVFNNWQDKVNGLAEQFSLPDLQAVLAEVDDPDFIRLGIEYLPLKFSRRHGDPSRPWNKFSINTHSEIDGSKILDYEGNWRDIFQNWEALAVSYPHFMSGMIFKFVNASTFDGYNPYRVTKDGFDWETIEEDDPWSYIGYWGDHQIIYLLKFLEFSEKYQPGKLQTYLGQRLFTYANVPYKIKAYEDILVNSKDTVDFDAELDEEIRARRNKIGADGALLTNKSGEIIRVNLMEKLLVSVLAKVSNFIPEGGIWMNTQRPEWNDANNALVGNGVSMVTLYYLRRFFAFFAELLEAVDAEKFELSTEVAQLFERLHQTLEQHQQLLDASINDADRKKVLDALETAAADYRAKVYENAFSGATDSVSRDQLRQFCRIGLAYFDHTIRANEREDGLYHAYNLMTVEENGVSIAYLDEMLEGQVAVLSAGLLSPEEVLSVLDGMRKSAIYRKDQNSYILYPNKQLPGFLEKNNVPAAAVESSSLLQALLAAGKSSIIQKDINGGYHFNGSFNNVKDLEKALDNLAENGTVSVSKQDRNELKQIFEDVFNHKAFTGRSGTFFGYEGLGSIYWHMVSKLQLAVLECCEQAIAEGADQSVINRLIEHYYAINEGVGVHKSPQLYGAFPTDPYSHTPAGKGAQQPGMTGQVKEDLLSRFGELGVTVTDGQLSFTHAMLRKTEFLESARVFNYIDVHEQPQQITLPPNSLAFTYCQVPIIYTLGDRTHVEAQFKDGARKAFGGPGLDVSTSKLVFDRSGKVTQIQVTVPVNELR